MRPCPETVDFERQGTPIGPVINARKQRGAERTMETGEGGETGRGRKEARTHVRKEGRKEGEEGKKEVRERRGYSLSLTYAEGVWRSLHRARCRMVLKSKTNCSN